MNLGVLTTTPVKNEVIYETAKFKNGKAYPVVTQCILLLTRTRNTKAKNYDEIIDYLKQF